jgi:hypothetical protein
VRVDVVRGYVTPEAAAADYAVVVQYAGDKHDLVRLDRHWELDATATRELRQARRDGASV